MTFVSSTSSAKYWMMVEAPAKRGESATPTKMMLSGRSRPKRENASTTRLDIMAPAKAKRAVMPMFTLALEPVIAGTTIRIANVAPKPAPCEMPTVEAEASGFSSTLCSTGACNSKPRARDDGAHDARQADALHSRDIACAPLTEQRCDAGGDIDGRSATKRARSQQPPRAPPPWQRSPLRCAVRCASVLA